jgi:hypothetical protein
LIVPARGGLPATVVTAPPIVTCRIAWFCVSATKSDVPLVPIPFGPLNRAAAPVPSANPAASAPPASVVTNPAPSIFRRTWFPASATKRSVPMAAREAGEKNRAAAPVTLSTKPVTPAVPAKVVTVPTAPEGVILRIVWLPVSATYTSAPREATPSGEEKLADSPTLSLAPEVPDPAYVVVAPSAATTLRILWLPVSATKSADPARSVAIPLGELNRTRDAVVLSADPEIPALPATVVTTPLVEMICRIVWFPVSHT